MSKPAKIRDSSVTEELGASLGKSSKQLFARRDCWDSFAGQKTGKEGISSAGPVPVHCEPLGHSGLADFILEELRLPMFFMLTVQVCLSPAFPVVRRQKGWWQCCYQRCNVIHRKRRIGFIPA